MWRSIYSYEYEFYLFLSLWYEFFRLRYLLLAILWIFLCVLLLCFGVGICLFVGGLQEVTRRLRFQAGG